MIKKGVGGIGAASTLQRSYVKAQIFLYWSFTAPRIMRCECTHAMEPLTFPNQYYTRQILLLMLGQRLWLSRAPYLCQQVSDIDTAWIASLTLSGAGSDCLLVSIR